MKKDGHPPYQEILFVDTATGHKFVCGSTMQPQDTETFEGKEYPVCRVAVSSSSHPFFTGSQQFVDSEGRVDKFRKRYARKAEEKTKEAAPAIEDKIEASKKAVKKTAPKKVAPKKSVKKAVKKTK